MTAIAPLSVFLVGMMGALVVAVALVRIAVAERRLLTEKARVALEAITPSDVVVDARPGGLAA